MTGDNIVKLCSTSMNGFRYNVFHKDDKEFTKILYMGEISEDGEHDSCTCTGYSLLSKCYHNKKAKEIRELKII